jgi:hypothetical protein
MATLSKHGKEIGRIEFIKKTLVYFENGDILEDTGFGWKMYGKLRDGVDPCDQIQRIRDIHKNKLSTIPGLSRYHELLCDVPLSKRWMLIDCIHANPQDPDGVWSDANDVAGIVVSVEDVIEMCKLYLAFSTRSNRASHNKLRFELMEK